MTRIYMNHFLKEKNSKEPQIALERDKLVYCNEVSIFDENGVLAAKVVIGNYRGMAGHEVKAWIEVPDSGWVEFE